MGNEQLAEERTETVDRAVGGEFVRAKSVDLVARQTQGAVLSNHLGVPGWVHGAVGRTVVLPPSTSSTTRERCGSNIRKSMRCRFSWPGRSPS